MINATISLDVTRYAIGSERVEDVAAALRAELPLDYDYDYSVRLPGGWPAVIFHGPADAIAELQRRYDVATAD
jgi:hypothetical protein